MATGAAIAGVVIAAFSANESREQGKEAEQAQRKSARVRRNEADLRNARNRRIQVAEQRRVRAATIAESEAAGTSGGSQVSGAVGSLATQSAANISFSNQLTAFDRQRAGFQSDVNTANRQADRASSISSFAFQGASFATQFT